LYFLDLSSVAETPATVNREKLDVLALTPKVDRDVADLDQVQSTELVNYPGIRLTLQLANNPRFLRWIIHSEAGCQIVH
jgi:hypothetical protein